MIIFDSIYVNNSGGKILLDYLLNKILSKNDFIFFIDSRLKSTSNYIENNANVFYSSASLLSRNNLYKKNNISLKLIFSFSNLPPLKKYNVPTYTYFHQLKFIYDQYDAPFNEKLRTYFQRFVFKYLSKNTDYFIVQSNFMAHQLSRKLNFDINKILVIPFFPPLNPLKTESLSKKLKDSFLYVSGGSLHKNHIRLIQAFAAHYKKHRIGELFITVSNPSKKLALLLDKVKFEKIPITNIGEIQREKLFEFYQKSEYLIYPSLAESFGLGLIEALEFDCKILGANLPYTFEVCDPSLVFDPFDIDSIEKAITTATNSILPFSKGKIENKIDELLKIFKTV